MTGIFKAYDIRGIYHGNGYSIDKLTPAMAYKIGYALAKDSELWPAGQVLVSIDMRESCAPLSQALAAGIADGGREVLYGGMMSTPMHYWYNRKWQVAGSVQITASHNPAEYNGFKISGHGALPLGYDSGLNRIEKGIHQSPELPETLPPLPATPQPEHMLLQTYVEFLQQKAPQQNWNICIDTGSGMAGYDSPMLLDALSAVQWDGLCLELDGDFPFHEANPLDYSTLTMLQDALRNGKYDLGVAFDGDGDRAIFLDGKGNIIRPDALTAFIAESYVLEQLDMGIAPGDISIVYDVRMSAFVREVIAKLGANPIQSKVGHAFMKQVLRDNDAIFGGEVSCHFYFRELGCTDSALYATLEGLRFMEKRGMRPEQLNDCYGPYPKSEEINFRVNDAQLVMQQMLAHFTQTQQPQVDKTDGITLQFDQRWFNLRASNTEPVLRLNAELNAPDATENQLQQWIDELAALIEKLGAA